MGNGRLAAIIGAGLALAAIPWTPVATAAGSTASFPTAVAASTANAAPTAVSRPGVATGAALGVSYGSATLTGLIAPHGASTSYYFQYGPTRAYGAQTPLAQIATLPVGHGAVRVSAPVGGLQPLTIYHYRLIAVNAAGATAGAERTFKTGKVPLSVQMLVFPNPAPFGGAITIQGNVFGTGNAGVPVELQANPFPYTQGFATVGNPQLTNPAGSFTFPFVGITAATQFRVVTRTKVPVVGPIGIERVAVNVQAHVGRTRRRHHARIYGTVTPAIDGMEVGIMRVLGGGRQRLVAGTILLHHNAASSRFSRVIHVKHRGLYRVFVKVTNGAQTSNYSQPLFIR